MKAGTAKLEITPNEPCYLCGHAIRTDLSEGVLDPLYVTALMLETKAGLNCWMSFDLGMMDAELTDQIKLAVQNAAGCEPDRIVCGFIHTHAGPEVSELGSFTKDREHGVRPGYRELLVRQAAAAAELAKAALTDCEVWISKTEIEGFYGNRSSRERRSDKDVNLIQFRTPQGVPVLTAVNLACHPTVLGPANLLISADLFGALRTGLEKAWGHSVLMMQGAAGDMGNRQYRRGEDAAELKRIRDGILPQLLGPLSWKPISAEPLRSKKTQYIIDYERDMAEVHQRLIQTEAELKAQRDPVQIKLLSSAAAALRYTAALDAHVHIELSGAVLQLGSLIVVTVPCELFNQLGVRIKQAFPDYDVLIWGYADTSVGYLFEQTEYGKSFESIATLLQPGMPEAYVQYLTDEIRQFTV